ncbi:hypothetical protein CYMTET_4251, partial [Cymbomonas tetramitiformis]
MASATTILQTTKYQECNANPDSCQSLSLNFNSLTGTVPTELGALTAMQSFFPGEVCGRECAQEPGKLVMTVSACSGTRVCAEAGSGVRWWAQGVVAGRRVWVGEAATGKRGSLNFNSLTGTAAPEAAAGRKLQQLSKGIRKREQGRAGLGRQTWPTQAVWWQAGTRQGRPVRAGRARQVALTQGSLLAQACGGEAATGNREPGKLVMTASACSGTRVCAEAASGVRCRAQGVVTGMRVWVGEAAADHPKAVREPGKLVMTASACSGTRVCAEAASGVRCRAQGNVAGRRVWVGEAATGKRGYLYSNSMTGTVPTELGALTAMQSFFPGEVCGRECAQEPGKLVMTVSACSGTRVCAEAGSGVRWWAQGVVAGRRVWVGEAATGKRGSLNFNSLTGTVPTELGALTAMQSFFPGEVCGRECAQEPGKLVMTVSACSGTRVCAEAGSGVRWWAQGVVAGRRVWVGEAATGKRGQRRGVVTGNGGEGEAARMQQQAGSFSSAVADQELTWPGQSARKVAQTYLYSNSMTGTVPTELGALTAMQSFRVEYNRNLCGDIPADVTVYSTAGTLLGQACPAGTSEDGGGGSSSPLMGILLPVLLGGAVLVGLSAALYFYFSGTVVDGGEDSEGGQMEPLARCLQICVSGKGNAGEPLTPISMASNPTFFIVDAPANCADEPHPDDDGGQEAQAIAMIAEAGGRSCQQMPATRLCDYSISEVRQWVERLGIPGAVFEELQVGGALLCGLTEEECDFLSAAHAATLLLAVKEKLREEGRGTTGGEEGDAGHTNVMAQTAAAQHGMGAGVDVTRRHRTVSNEGASLLVEEQMNEEGVQAVAEGMQEEKEEEEEEEEAGGW